MASALSMELISVRKMSGLSLNCTFLPKGSGIWFLVFQNAEYSEIVYPVTSVKISNLLYRSLWKCREKSFSLKYAHVNWHFK